MRECKYIFILYQDKIPIYILTKRTHKMTESIGQAGVEITSDIADAGVVILEELGETVKLGFFSLYL